MNDDKRETRSTRQGRPVVVVSELPRRFVPTLSKKEKAAALRRSWDVEKILRLTAHERPREDL